MFRFNLFHQKKQKKVLDEKMATEEKLTAVRKQWHKQYQEFLEGEGRLPEGFSFKYNEFPDTGPGWKGTPFDAYLAEIRDEVDVLKDTTNISDWVYLESSVDINTATEAIVDWVKKHREFGKQLYYTYSTPEGKEVSTSFVGSRYCYGKIMVVLDSNDEFDAISKEAVQACIETDISFCTIIPDICLYDLIEQKKKRIKYNCYPNYHDEDHADWWLE